MVYIIIFSNRTGVINGNFSLSLLASKSIILEASAYSPSPEISAPMLNIVVSKASPFSPVLSFESFSPDESLLVGSIDLSITEWKLYPLATCFTVTKKLPLLISFILTLSVTSSVYCMLALVWVAGIRPVCFYETILTSVTGELYVILSLTSSDTFFGNDSNFALTYSMADIPCFDIFVLLLDALSFGGVVSIFMVFALLWSTGTLNVYPKDIISSF